MLQKALKCVFCGIHQFVGSHGQMLESRIHNRKVVSSSLGPAGIVGGGSECPALVEISRGGAVEQGTKPPTAPWAPQHRWLPTSPGVCSLCVCVCVCVYSLLCVCTLDRLNAEHKFRVWVTILGRMSRHFHCYFHLLPTQALKMIPSLGS